MKKIYAFFALSFLLFSASFSFADARHNRIIQSYIDIHPKDQNIFYTLNTIEGNSDLNNAHLVLTGKELINNKDHFLALLQIIPDLHIILDVEENDGLVTNGSLSLGRESLGRDLILCMHRLMIMNLAQDVRIIGDHFLSGSRKLTELDFSSLNQVEQIGHGFLSGCSNLSQLDLSHLSCITQIGNSFLKCCSGLLQLDLSPLSKVEQIERGFLSGCTRLTQLDLSHLSKVNQIGHGFLYFCKSLISLDLSPLSQVTQIRNNFLSNCDALTELDFSPLSQVEQIGDDFLSDCLGFVDFNQIRLPAYNPNLKAALEVTFPQDTNIGDMIREVYVEGYVPVQKNTKGAR